MSRLTKNEIREAIETWETQGRGALTGPQRKLLVRLITQDLRCADALLSHARSEITERQLIDVLTATWINEPLMHVEDNRPRLLKAARSADDPDRPISSLVLVATWLEHSLNALLVIGAARDGMSGKQLNKHAEKVGKDKMRKKLDEWRSYPGAPLLQSWVIADLREVFHQRNESVHFRWIGDDYAVLETRITNLREAAAKAWKLVDELGGIENRLSARSTESEAIEFFSVQIGEGSA